MPLSEDEQRVLRDIERSFYESDPEFARTVSHTPLSRGVRLLCLFSAVGFFLCLVALVTLFWLSLVVALAAFIGMMVCAAIFIGNVRRVGLATLLTVLAPKVSAKAKAGSAAAAERTQDQRRRVRRTRFPKRES